MTFKLKNESKRSFQVGPDNTPFLPGTVGVFSDETAKTLLKHKGIIDIDNLTVDYQESEVKDFSAAGKKKDKVAKPVKPAKGAKASDDDALADALKDE